MFANKVIIFHAERLLHTLVQGVVLSKWTTNNILQMEGLKYTYYELCDMLSKQLSNGNGCPWLVFSEEYCSSDFLEEVNNLKGYCNANCHECFYRLLFSQEAFKDMVDNGIIQETNQNKALKFEKKK